MRNKDIEKLLKESVEEVKVKDFSERWTEIRGTISQEQNDVLQETSTETVLSTSSNSNVTKKSASKKIIYSLCAFFLLTVLCLAIVLPITLNKGGERKYLNLSDLTVKVVTDSVFSDKLNETGLEIVNFDKLEINVYMLIVDGNDIVGGGLEVIDEVYGIYSELMFFDLSVESLFKIGEDYKTCKINGFEIEYSTELTDGNYVSKIKALKRNTKFQIECIALEEDITGFLEKIFG